MVKINFDSYPIKASVLLAIPVLNLPIEIH